MFRLFTCYSCIPYIFVEVLNVLSVRSFVMHIAMLRNCGFFNRHRLVSVLQPHLSCIAALPRVHLSYYHALTCPTVTTLKNAETDPSDVLGGV